MHSLRYLDTLREGSDSRQTPKLGKGGQRSNNNRADNLPWVFSHFARGHVLSLRGACAGGAMALWRRFLCRAFWSIDRQLTNYPVRYLVMVHSGEKSNGLTLAWH